MLQDKRRFTDEIYLDFCDIFHMDPFNILLSKLERDGFDEWTRIKCSPCKFADDLKLSDAGDISEGQDAIQRDLDKLEKWTHGNLMSYNKTKCMVLHVGLDNPRYQAGG
ncbi:hypothetical protein HGM15179_013004 [Zosterops borbonicus]|uniref:Rna-directed dna polymerase from mobile element jockey-like n=1 Tax=Zosterops borbonicus TaxID=364589 RepID=A0A8K1G9L9_9PASS|nr:hypothetical protein HGM15179_013004 [Zosterops borbonicus]